MFVISLPSIGFAQDDDTTTLPPITVEGSSGCSGSQPTHGFTTGCSGGGGGGGGGTTTPGSGGGFGGGGGPSGPTPQQGPVLEQSPLADDEVNCGSIGEIRWAYAGVEAVYSRENSGTTGNPLNGTPAPATAYTVQFSNGERESFIAGPYGSPTIAAGSPIPGTCH